MSDFLDRIQELASKGDVLISSHGYDELAADNVLVRDVLKGVARAVVIREYPDYAKGPCALMLQRDATGEPIHVVWGIERGKEHPAVVVTAYRPDPRQWNSDFVTRKDR